MVHDALAKFDEIYEAQADGKVFATPEELWGKTSFHFVTLVVGRGIGLTVRDLLGGPLEAMAHSCLFRIRISRGLPFAVVLFVRGDFFAALDANGICPWLARPSHACVGDVDLLDLTKITITDHIHERVGRAGSLIERDLAFASNRVNYNQVSE